MSIIRQGRSPPILPATRQSGGDPALRVGNIGFAFIKKARLFRKSPERATMERLRW